MDKKLEIASVEIILPDWLPHKAVDRRQGIYFDEYWEMVASGSVFLSEDQMNQALRFVAQIDQLLRSHDKEK